MVSLGKYLVTFSTVMPKRVEKAHNILKVKTELDQKLEKKDTSVISEIKKIIGEDSLFKKAYTDGQSLRYNIRKYKKSFDFMKEHTGSLLTGVDQKNIKELKKLGINLAQMTESLTKISTNASSFADTLDTIYFNEFMHLKNNNIEQYLIEVKKEQQCITNLQQYTNSTETEIKLFWNNIEHASKIEKWNENISSIIRLILNGIVMMGITVGLFVTFAHFAAGYTIMGGMLIAQFLAEKEMNEAKEYRKEHLVEGLISNII